MSEGNIRIGGRSTTTDELGIRKQADGAHQTLSAQADLQAIAQQQKTVAQTTAQIKSAVQTYSSNRAAQYERAKAQVAQVLTAQMSPEEQAAFQQKSDSEKEQYYKQHSSEYQQLDQQAGSWGTGGSNSRAVNAATTAITGLLGGQSLQQAAVNAGSPYAAEAIGNTFSEHGSLPNGWAWLAAHGALGAITAKANGGNAGAGALSAAGGELVVSIAAEKMFGAKAIDATGKFNIDLLTENEKKQLSALGAATGAALGLAAGGNSHNAQTGGVVAQNAVENNAVDLKDGKSYSIKYADTVNNRDRYSEHVLLNEEIKRKSEDFTRQAYNCNSISSCEYWLNRFNALYVQYNKAMKPLSASKDEYKQQQHYFLVTQAHELLNSDIRKVKERLDIYKREEANKPSRQADYSVDRQAPERIGVYMLNGVRIKGVANDGRFAAGLGYRKLPSLLDYMAVHTDKGSLYLTGQEAMLGKSANFTSKSINQGMSKTTQKGKGKGKSGGFSIVAGHFHATTPKEKEFKDKLKESGVYNTELGFQNPKIVEEIDRERKDYVNNQWLPGLSSTIGECKWHICFNRVETIPTRIKASEIGIGSKKNSSPNVGVGYTIKVKGLHDLLENLRKNEDKDK